jgi:hypothetical protein
MEQQAQSDKTLDLKYKVVDKASAPGSWDC